MRRSITGLPILFFLLLAGCGTATPTANPTASPAGPPATASPTEASTQAAATAPAAEPTATATTAATVAPSEAPLAACKADELKGAVTRWEGAAGHQIATVSLVDDGPTPCLLQGTPQLQLADATGIVLIDSTERGDAGLPHVGDGDPAFQLDPGSAIGTLVSVSNYCGDVEPILPTTIAMVLPADGGRIVLDPGPGGDAPACMSTPGDAGLIEMNGWTR